MRHYPPRKPRTGNTSWNGTRDRATQARFRKAIIARDGFKCWECGKLPTPADPLQAHHVTATDGRLLCREHHKEADDHAR